MERLRKSHVDPPGKLWRARVAFRLRLLWRPVDARKERLARNEVLFRDVNERIEQTAVSHGGDPHTYEFLCECSNIDCSLRIRMTIDAYERVRADPRCFVVAPGHELPEIEEVVQRNDEYQVVRKEGTAADLVTARDPRS